MYTAYFKLRANIELEGDIKIAEREIRALCTNLYFVERSKLDKAKKILRLSEDHYLSNTREQDGIGFNGQISQNDLKSLITKSSFIQEVWILDPKPNLKSIFGKAFVQRTDDATCCVIPLFAMAELLTYNTANEVTLSTLKSFVLHLANKKIDAELAKIVKKSITSTPHVHGLHKYKAKFFPRLVRSLILTESKGKNVVTILDPFVGSGTALIESSFMGYKSIGVDIDKLSCLISESKVSLLNSTYNKLKSEISHYYTSASLSKQQYKFPTWISRKFDRWDNKAEQDVYENEISSLTKKLSNLNGSRNIFETSISDAVSRKFNIRMMGTGVGRFALEIQKTSLKKIFDSNIKFLTKANSVVNVLKDAYALDLPIPKIINGSATALPIKNASVDMIVTSPPYLPASSGREDYLIGKSIAITALNLMDENEIREAEFKSVGSMNSQSINTKQKLPERVYSLYNFLNNDALRKIKADPTIAYYNDIKNALDESFRVLVSGGVAIYIIGKESVFYTFKTREILFRAECDKIFEEMAISAGFLIKEVIDIELNKKNKNARPRSLDKYYESAFILEKPSQK